MCLQYFYRIYNGKGFIMLSKETTKTNKNIPYTYETKNLIKLKELSLQLSKNNIEASSYIWCSNLAFVPQALHWAGLLLLIDGWEKT